MGGIKPPNAGEDKHVKESSDLYRAAEENNFHDAQAAVAAGADVNTTSLQNVTPLLLAVKHGNVQLVQFLLSKNANPNLVSSECGPLHEAVRKHNVQVVDLLLEKKRKYQFTCGRRQDRDSVCDFGEAF